MITILRKELDSSSLRADLDPISLKIGLPDTQFGKSIAPPQRGLASSPKGIPTEINMSSVGAGRVFLSYPPIKQPVFPAGRNEKAIRTFARSTRYLLKPPCFFLSISLSPW